MQEPLLAFMGLSAKDIGEVIIGCALAYAFVHKVFEGIRQKRGDTAKANAGNPDVLRKTSRIDEEIHDLLTELKVRSHACRVLLYLFHNGEKFFDGGPIQRMTCAYESVKGGTSRIMDDQKGITTSIMADFMARMFDDTPTINKTEDMKDTYCKTMLDDLSVIGFACIPIHQTPHKIVGCVQVHWNANAVPFLDDKAVDTDGVINETDRIKEDIKDEEKKEYMAWFDVEVEKVMYKLQNKLNQRLAVSGTHAI